MGRNSLCSSRRLKRKEYVCHSKYMFIPRKKGCCRSPPLTYSTYHEQTIANKEILEGFCLLACLPVCLLACLLEWCWRTNPVGSCFLGSHCTSAKKSFFCLFISEADSPYLAQDGPPPSSYLCLPSTGIRSMSTMAGFQKS